MGEEQPERILLIPGLPDDIAMDCLVRIPCQFHSGLRQVCRRWKDLVTTPSFYHHRIKAGTGEALVCLVQAQVSVGEGAQQGTAGDGGGNTGHGGGEKGRSQNWTPPSYGLSLYNATLDSWHRISSSAGAGATAIRPIPLFAQCAAVPSAGKLVLLGGWDPETLDSVPEVHVLDLFTGRRSRGKPMSVGRSFFACAAVGPLVYVAGGHDNQKNALRSAEVYDVAADEWRPLPPMADERDESRGVACGGKFWVVSGYGSESQGRFDSGAEFYDPVAGNWTREEGLLGEDEVSGGNPQHSSIIALPSFSKSGEERLWNLDCCGGRRGIREYEGKEKRWKVVGPIPESLKSSPCAAAIAGAGIEKVFVLGSDGEQRHKAWVMETNGSRRWKLLVETPANFSGFAYSTTAFLL